MSDSPPLRGLLRHRHDEILQNLQNSSTLIDHPTAKGDSSEEVWIEALRTYLPQRYEVRRGFAIDSLGTYSKQLDIIIHDRFYTPFILKVGGHEVVPIESVYAVFEVKQTLCRKNIKEARDRVGSVRNLRRCFKSTPTVPIPRECKIISGLLSTRSEIKKYDSNIFRNDELLSPDAKKLDYVISARDGVFYCDKDSYYQKCEGAWIAFFFLHLIESLQYEGTVAPIDLSAYREFT